MRRFASAALGASRKAPASGTNSSPPDNRDLAKLVRDVVAGSAAEKAASHISQYKLTNDVKQLDEGIEAMKIAIEHFDENSKRSMCFSLLGDYLYLKYERSQNAVDFNISLSRTREAIELSEPGAGTKAMFLNEMIGRVHERYEKTKSEQLLRDLTWCTEEMAEELGPEAAEWENMVRNIRHCRIQLYKQTKESTDIDSGVRWCQTTSMKLDKQLLETSSGRTVGKGGLFGRLTAKSRGPKSRGVLLETILDLIHLKSRDIKTLADTETFSEALDDLNRIQTPDREKALFYLADMSEMLEWKYSQTNEETDLDRLIKTYQAMVPLTKVEDKGARINVLDQLAGHLSQKYQLTNDMDVILESLRISELACAEMHADEDSGEERRCASSHNVIHKHRLIYERTGELSTLDTIVRLRRQFAQIVPRTGQWNKTTAYFELGETLVERSEKSGSVPDLEEAIGAYDNCLSDLGSGHTQRSMVLIPLSAALQKLYERTKEASHRTRAEKIRAEAESTKSERTARELNSLQETENLDEINSAIEENTKALESLLPEDDKWGPLCSGTATLHMKRFEGTRSSGDLKISIQLLTKYSIQLHIPENPYVLSLLAVALMHRSRIDPLYSNESKRATAVALRAAEAAENLARAERALCYCNIGQVYHQKFEHSKDVADLDESVRWYEKSVGISDEGDGTLARDLSNMSAICMLKYGVTTKISDLQEAIGWAEEAILAAADDWPPKASILSNLSQMLRTRCQQTMNLKDLDEAVDLAERSVSMSTGSATRWMKLNSLATAILTRAERKSSKSDYERAIELLEQALEEAPTEHPQRESIFSNLQLAKTKASAKPSNAPMAMLQMLAEALTGKPFDESVLPPEMMQMLSMADSDTDASESDDNVAITARRGKTPTMSNQPRIVEIGDDESDDDNPLEAGSRVNVVAHDLPSANNSHEAPAIRRGKGNAQDEAELDRVFALEYAKSKGWWNTLQNTQLYHVTSGIYGQSNVLHCAYFRKYLESADERDLPQLPAGGKFPSRPWKVLRDHLVAKGAPLSDDEIRQMRQEEEDHPKIKEWLGTNYGWHEELFGADEWAEKLCRYSPYRWER